jgi:hypothetical protein
VVRALVPLVTALGVEPATAGQRLPSGRVFWPYGGSLCLWVVWTSPDVGGARGGEFAADESEVRGRQLTAPAAVAQVDPDLANERGSYLPSQSMTSECRVLIARRIAGRWRGIDAQGCSLVEIRARYAIVFRDRGHRRATGYQPRSSQQTDDDSHGLFLEGVLLARNHESSLRPSDCASISGIGNRVTAVIFEVIARRSSCRDPLGEAEPRIAAAKYKLSK